SEPKTAPSIGKKNVSTSGNSENTASKMNVLTSGNHTVSLSNSFDALNDDNLVIMEVELGKCLLVVDDGKPLEIAISLGDHNSDDEVEYVDNDIARFLASNLTRVGYGTKSLLEQWNESYENADYDYDHYDNDMYVGQEFPNNLHAICDITISCFEVKIRNRLPNVI
nr:hypothetical protein [Tanacetum cinerariifolium]